MTEGRCPSCGAPVAFTAGGARVVVCGHCQTVVAREGAELVGRGRVAALVDTETPLRLGLEGRYQGTSLRLLGHLQRDHGAGVWDEWYVELEDGRSGWLAEAEGALHLLFFAGEQPGAHRADFRPGLRTRLGDTLFTVEEVRTSRLVAAAGQLPSDVSREGEAVTVDATAPGGLFATLDLGADERTPELFVGRRVRLEELGIPPDQLTPRVRKARLVQARCTQCNGPLELKAPDHTRRVACPYCGALLDASQGRLAFLQALEPPAVKPVIPLGAKGVLGRTEWTVVGFMVRSATVEGTRYPWEEYLLYHPARGFSFLLDTTGHWVHLLPVNAGEVTDSFPASARYQGRSYRAFQRVTAVTEAVLGEFYWEVRAGERAEATEFVAPPHSLHADRTREEVTYTHGTYLAPRVVQDAFKLPEALPAPWGIAPSQPNPHRRGAAEGARWAALYGVVGLLLFVLASATAARQEVHAETVALAPGVAPGSPEAVHLSAPFELPRRGNLRAEVSSPVDNGWLGVQGDLVNEETGEVVSFYEEVSRYSGVEAGEAWSEGERSATEYLSRVPPGRYVLRTTPFFPSGGVPGSYSVRLTSGVPRLLWLGLLWLLLALFPLVALLRAGGFESRRWLESNLGGGE